MKITLTKEEQKMWELALDKDLENTSSEKYKEILLLREKLMKSLLKKGLIPEIRLNYFFDLQYNLSNTKKSRYENFKNLEVPYQHPHFYKYLTYFVEGPCIPNELLNTINEIRKKYPYYPSDSLDEVKKAVRSYLKNDPKNKSNLAEELYKLYLEFGDSNAELIRKYTMNLPR
ncbi:MAG: hypothetical protein KBB37_01705 [Bacteroidia bacterium]|nr:hypothetical protein [Bacteroidia bacterium]MBP7259973.1 hypothetical protein [Bacteroidia bacterium]MBP9181216.1 hypothetical protein [Bacteroidia bacterium]MBP9723920.1 hypothetical protein [Bacteroidia bacterium]